jgi:hypothetical protein
MGSLGQYQSALNPIPPTNSHKMLASSTKEALVEHFALLGLGAVLGLLFAPVIYFYVLLLLLALSR